MRDVIFKRTWERRLNDRQVEVYLTGVVYPLTAAIERLALAAGVIDPAPEEPDERHSPEAG